MNKIDLAAKIKERIEVVGILQNIWKDIPDQVKHPSDNIEHVRDIHNTQNRLMSIAYLNHISK